MQVFLQAHWAIVLMIAGAVWTAAISALPDPEVSSSKVYIWAYAFVHLLPKFDMYQSKSAMTTLVRKP